MAAAFGAAAYVAVFMAIGSIAQRAAVWSLAFVFLVERLLGAALERHRAAVALVGGPRAYVGLAHAPSTLHRRRHPPRGAASVRLLLITVVGLAITVNRLPRRQMASSTD